MVIFSTISIHDFFASPLMDDVILVIHVRALLNLELNDNVIFTKQQNIEKKTNIIHLLCILVSAKNKVALLLLKRMGEGEFFIAPQ